MGLFNRAIKSLRRTFSPRIFYQSLKYRRKRWMLRRAIVRRYRECERNLSALGHSTALVREVVGKQINNLQDRSFRARRMSVDVLKKDCEKLKIPLEEPNRARSRKTREEDRLQENGDLNTIYSLVEEAYTDVQAMLDEFLEKNRVGRDNTRVMLATAGILLALLAAVLLFGSFLSRQREKIRPIGINYEEVLDSNYNDLCAELERNGFLDVRRKAVSDLNYVELEKAGSVAEVKINNKVVRFRADTEIHYDDRITVLYHDAKNVKMPANARDFRDRPYTEAAELLKDAGFGNITVEGAEEAFLEGKKEAGTVAEVQASGNSRFRKKDYYPVDAPIIIRVY